MCGIGACGLFEHAEGGMCPAPCQGGGWWAAFTMPAALLLLHAAVSNGGVLDVELFCMCANYLLPVVCEPCEEPSGLAWK